MHFLCSKPMLVTASLAALQPAVQEPAASPPAAAQKAAAIRFDATTMVIPAGRHEIRALIDASAHFLKRNILCDDGQLQIGNVQPVELQQPMTLDANGCDEAVGQLLYSHGYVVVQRDAPKGIYEVIACAGPRAMEALAAAVHRSPEEILARPTLCQPVTTVVKLQSVNATIAVNSLRPFFAQAGNQALGLTIGTAGNNDALLLSGLQNKVADAILLLRKADGQDGQDAQGGQQPAPDDAHDLHTRIAALAKSVQALAERLTALEQRLGPGK